MAAKSTFKVDTMVGLVNFKINPSINIDSVVCCMVQPSINRSDVIRHPEAKLRMPGGVYRDNILNPALDLPFIMNTTKTRVTRVFLSSEYQRFAALAAKASIGYKIRSSKFNEVLETLCNAEHSIDVFRRAAALVWCSCIYADLIHAGIEVSPFKFEHPANTNVLLFCMLLCTTPNADDIRTSVLPRFRNVTSLVERYAKLVNSDNIRFVQPYIYHHGKMDDRFMVEQVTFRLGKIRKREKPKMEQYQSEMAKVVTEYFEEAEKIKKQDGGKALQIEIVEVDDVDA